MPEPELYRAHSENLIWAEWESSFTLFNRATGETHLLSPIPAEILFLLSDNPTDIDTLAQKLSTRCGTSCTSEWTAQTAESVARLQSLELVEKLPAQNS